MDKKNRRGLTPEEKLNASLKKIDSVFFRMQKNKISPREGKGMSDNTKKTYSDLMKSLMREIYKDTGVSDITKITEIDILHQLEKRARKYKAGSQNESYNIKAIRSAVKSFAFGAEKTKVFERPVKFNGEQVDKMIQDQKIIRKSKFSANLRATEKEVEKVVENIEKNGYSTQTKKIAADALRVSAYSGGRIEAALKLKPENILENEDGTISIWFLNGKGGLDYKTDIYNVNHIGFFKDFKERGIEGREILKGKRSDGTFKSTRELKREISKITEKNSLEFRKQETIRHRVDGKRVTEKFDVKFTTHSARKAFANERAKFYWDLLKTKDIGQILSERRPEELEKLQSKYKKELERIYQARKKFTPGKTSRDLTREEKALFLTTIDTGHFRNTVLKQYYIDQTEFRKYQKENP